ncbi:hypothetical protein VCSRO91_2831 [Vibrio cholerae]|nr:hypothetical protein VCSRO91_2831 [Vibrio cholerae]
MLLIEYIESHYGKVRGNRRDFLADNPLIIAQELSRWLKNEYKVHLGSGEIYKPTSKTVNLVNIKTLTEDSNREFCQQMADALVTLGTEEVLNCMARFMSAIAQHQNATLEFDCDLASVRIETKQLPPLVEP